jgi:membrane protease YdiL (CAAX protease family)
MSSPPIHDPDPSPVPGDPAQAEPMPAYPPRRIPHIGHALLFVGFTGITLMVLEVLLALLGESPASLRAGAVTVLHPKLQLAMMGATYLTTLLAAWLFYPLVWHRDFLDGVQWHWSTARAQASRLIALGFALGVLMALITAFVATPKSLPIDEFFLTPTTAWIITVFGTFGAPVFEEICFRGFLFPAFAIAYDWIALPRTPEARTGWQTTTTLTPASLVFSAVLTSMLFAMLHAEQVAHLWVVLLVLFSISLVLTYVRVKTQSVAASAIVHASYNGFIFLVTIIATGGYRHLDRMTH